MVVIIVMAIGPNSPSQIQKQLMFPLQGLLYFGTPLFGRQPKLAPETTELLGLQDTS
jgi:hypothetical protein